MERLPSELRPRPLRRSTDIHKTQTYSHILTPDSAMMTHCCFEDAAFVGDCKLVPCPDGSSRAAVGSSVQASGLIRPQGALRTSELQLRLSKTASNSPVMLILLIVDEDWVDHQLRRPQCHCHAGKDSGCFRWKARPRNHLTAQSTK